MSQDYPVASSQIDEKVGSAAGEGVPPTASKDDRDVGVAI